MKRIDWRVVLGRMPLPMLALAASYGVWSFNLLFVPAWVAFVSAAAFEGVYVGLAVAQVRPADRRRASLIAGTAVAVSVLYNVAAGLFHRRPELLLDAPLWLDALLALMHGMPLAVVAYAVASLLLHAEHPQDATMPASPLIYARLADAFPAPQPTGMYARPESIDATPHACPKCHAPLDAARWRAARRWGHCSACKHT